MTRAVLIIDAGYSVQESASGEEALSCLDRESVRLAVVDLHHVISAAGESARA